MRVERLNNLWVQKNLGTVLSFAMGFLESLCIVVTNSCQVSNFLHFCGSDYSVDWFLYCVEVFLIDDLHILILISRTIGVIHKVIVFLQ